MNIFWIITLLIGFGLYYTARDSCHYALRLISRTFGPLLIVAGAGVVAINPSSWGIASVIFGVIIAGVAVTIALMLVAKVRRRTTR